MFKHIKQNELIDFWLCFMKLNYVNVQELKDPSSHSKRKRIHPMFIERIKKELKSFDEDILEYYFSKYEIPNSCSKKEEKIDYLAENYPTTLEKDFLNLKRNYFEPKNILLGGKLNNLDNFTLNILFLNFEFPFFSTNKTKRINYILEEFSFKEIENVIISSEKEAIKRKVEENIRKEKIKRLEYQLEILDDKSLEVLYKKFNISSHLSRESKKKALLLDDSDILLNEINSIKSVNSKEIDLRKKLNSLNDMEINALFDIFFDFGDFLSRKNKIYSLSKVDNEKIYEEIDKLNR